MKQVYTTLLLITALSLAAFAGEGAVLPTAEQGEKNAPELKRQADLIHQLQERKRLASDSLKDQFKNMSPEERAQRKQELRRRLELLRETIKERKAENQNKETPDWKNTEPDAALPAKRLKPDFEEKMKNPVMPKAREKEDLNHFKNEVMQKQEEKSKRELEIREQQKQRENLRQKSEDNDRKGDDSEKKRKSESQKKPGSER